MEEYKVECYRKGKLGKSFKMRANSDDEAKEKARVLATGWDMFNLLKNLGENFSSCAYLVHLGKPAEEMSLF